MLIFRSDVVYTSDSSCSEDSDTTSEVEGDSDSDVDGMSSDSDGDFREEDISLDPFQVDLTESKAIIIFHCFLFQWLYVNIFARHFSGMV